MADVSPDPQTSRELAEDVSPASPAQSPVQRELSEDEAPRSRLEILQAVHTARQQDDLHRTRRWLAIALFWLVAVMTILPVLALLLGYWTHFTVDQFKELGLFFTPIVTLASAAFGFFFASDERDRRR